MTKRNWLEAMPPTYAAYADTIYTEMITYTPPTTGGYTYTPVAYVPPTYDSTTGISTGAATNSSDATPTQIYCSAYSPSAGVKKIYISISPYSTAYTGSVTMTFTPPSGSPVTETVTTFGSEVSSSALLTAGISYAVSCTGTVKSTTLTSTYSSMFTPM